jgi:hypothetical protein
MLDYWNRWLLGWVTLADALVAILTLGVWYPHWQMDYIAWQIRRDFRARNPKE